MHNKQFSKPISNIPSYPHPFSSASFPVFYSPSPILQFHHYKRQTIIKYKSNGLQPL